MNPHPETTVTFTPDWGKIYHVVESVPEELRGIREDLRASAKASNDALRLAHERMDGIQAEVRTLASVQSRWGAFGAGICAVVVALWGLLKFVFNRG